MFDQRRRARWPAAALLLLTAGVAAEDAATGCFDASPSDFPFCSAYVSYKLPLAIKSELKSRDQQARDAVDSQQFPVCPEFFGLPAFQCFKFFPGCKQDGTPKLACASICKRAYQREFDACYPGYAEGGFTIQCECAAENPDCSLKKYFTATDTDCADHYDALFPTPRVGSGVIVGISMAVAAFVFVCALYCCSRRHGRHDLEETALQVASRTDNLDADDEEDEHAKRVLTKQDLIKKRDRIIKNYGQVGGLLALHSLLLLSMAMVTPYWTSDTLTMYDATNFNNATMEFQYGLWDFTTYGGSDLLHEQVSREVGTGLWAQHCNHTRFVRNPSLLPSGFCDWPGDALKYATVTCAAFSGLMVIMLLVNYHIQALSWNGTMLSALQAIGTLFIVVMWPYTMQSFYQNEQVVALREMRTIGGAFEAPKTAKFGDSYYLVCASFVFSMFQIYFFHVCHVWVLRDPNMFGDDGKLKVKEAYCGPVTVMLWFCCPCVCFCPVDKRYTDAPAPGAQAAHSQQRPGNARQAQPRQAQQRQQPVRQQPAPVRQQAPHQWQPVERSGMI